MQAEQIYFENNTSIKVLESPMICNSCGSTIISKHHAENCNTIKMYQILEETLTDNFKPMMTYGLGGCHAFIMINKNTKHMIFIHHPFFEMIKIIYNMNYNPTDNFVVILKTPGTYVKESDKNWKMKSENESNQRQFLERYNVTVNFVPYNLSHVSCDIFNSTFYCNYKNKKFEYIDSYGTINYVDL
jgi:hypothetical protein